MQITTNSGQAGAVSSIRVRGFGSMNASNEPLYVVDGVPVVSGNTGQMSGYIYATNNVMSTLNPQDIESITVLKMPLLRLFYGSRAANGVILVTTKSGRLGKPVVNFKASVGITPSFATENLTSQVRSNKSSCITKTSGTQENTTEKQMPPQVLRLFPAGTIVSTSTAIVSLPTTTQSIHPDPGYDRRC